MSIHGARGLTPYLFHSANSAPSAVNDLTQSRRFFPNIVLCDKTSKCVCAELLVVWRDVRCETARDLSRWRPVVSRFGIVLSHCDSIIPASRAVTWTIGAGVWWTLETSAESLGRVGGSYAELVHMLFGQTTAAHVAYNVRMNISCAVRES